MTLEYHFLRIHRMLELQQQLSISRLPCDTYATRVHSALSLSVSVGLSVGTDFSLFLNNEGIPFPHCTIRPTAPMPYRLYLRGAVLCLVDE